MSEVLTIQDFATHLHTRFRVASHQSYELELTEVTDHSNGQLEQFSLIFTGTTSPSLQQNTYMLDHPQMGRCELFLAAIGPGDAGMRYEAVFSRHI